MKKELKELIISEPKKASKGFYIGTIYAFSNLSNEKIYIGKTVDPYNERFIEHKCSAFTKNTMNYFYNALRKYSWDGFERVVIYQTEEMESKIEADKIILEKEKFYINLFRTDNHEFGYNLTKGGDGIAGYKHTEESKKKMSESHKGEKHWNYGNYNNSTSSVILQYDLDFNFIKEWPSMSEIERELGYNANNISRCCSNKIDTYKGFIWVKKEDYFDGYLQKYKSRAKCKSNDKTVMQFDFLGNFIAEYISCAEAGKHLKKGSPSTAANGRDPQLHGFIWIYKQDFSEELLREKLERVKTCKIYNKVIKSITI